MNTLCDNCQKQETSVTLHLGWRNGHHVQLCKSCNERLSEKPQKAQVAALDKLLDIVEGRGNHCG